MQRVAVDREYVQRTAIELVQCNSINPGLVLGAPGEAEVARICGEKMRRLGLEVDFLDAAPGRTSVVGRLRGSGGGKSLMLNAHLDTVGVEGMPEPFSGKLTAGRLYGRGAYDMKGSAAACLAAAKALVDAKIALAGDLLLALVADEEYESRGTQQVIERYRTDAAIVTEPTQLDICLAHKGFIWLEVEVRGRAAHGSRFEEGVDANMRMGRFLAELERLERDLRQRTPHPLVGPPSLHAATLHGGSGLSTYAEKCVLQIERRTIPGEIPAEAVAELQALLDELEKADPSFRSHLEVLCNRDAFEVSRNAGLVKVVQQAAEMALNRTPQLVGDTPWMDSALLSSAGIQTVVLGPVGGGAHSAEEWVEVRSLEQLAALLAALATEFCNREKN